MSDKVLTALEKYFPIVANLNILAIHLLWKYLSFDFREYSNIALSLAFVPFLILYGYSKRHYFCLWHRILLLNIIAHSILYFMDSIISKLGYQFINLFYVTLWVTVLTLIVATALMFKDGCFQTNKKSILRSWERHGLRSMESVERQRAGGINEVMRRISLYLHSNCKR